MILCQDLLWGAANSPLTPHLNIQLPAGSLTAVVGANGAGKSSLLKVLAGLQKPLSGRFRIGAEGTKVGYLNQRSAIDRQFPISLGELVSGGFWGQHLSRRERRQRLRQALRAWDIDKLEAHTLEALSGGELQRALLARLSLTDANLLLLDEPDSALDKAGQALLWRHIDAWHKTGHTVVVVSHDLSRVREMAEYCLLVDSEGCQYGPSHSVIGQASLGEVQ
ncbi:MULTISPECIES: metal ABC transporter ATP-binding protein [Pseudomonas]|uniref:High-affinity zinc uptake system ATP-binding protein ZnuC n=1 Tax=Pseudomonas putida TaxID=303 RepID=A0A1B2F8G0_PSEPU|nr:MULTISPECIES: ATP-binding cassette domain-containing protein [Pseudomonas]ANY88424.1 High-affinity zinc uptake system ATP-binding protein ZnuC [Pseudomonas putida]MCL8307596.1 ATP-binding cassette domain-containing protein [Pseudomonas putida]